MLSALYGAAAMWRRRRYLRHPSLQRHLRQPVISIGNLSVGGSGKTPIVAAIARLLVAEGERPSILSRGYGRLRTRDGVTVVSDGAAVRAKFEDAGDEPLMLARMLSGVPVLVGANRHLSGRFAEEELNATVHLLDDGFQHFQLARDVDLLVTDEQDLRDTVLPGGRLREPRRAARYADAALVRVADDAEAERIAHALGVSIVFRVERSLATPRVIGAGYSVATPSTDRIFAVAGIARPQPFFDGLASAGWCIVGTMTFADHHVFTDRDIERVWSAARAAGATIIMTTEKDAARLKTAHLDRLRIATVPLTAQIEPAARFAEWLRTRLRDARDRRETSDVRPNPSSHPDAARGDGGPKPLAVVRVAAWRAATITES